MARDRSLPMEEAVMPRRVPTAATKGAVLIKRLNSIVLGKLTPDRPEPDETAASMLADAVDRGVFREESVREVPQVVHEILKAERIRKTGYSNLVAEAGCPDSFLYKIPVFASLDRAADLNETLANRLVSQPDLMADPGTKFVPMFIGIRVDGGHTERAVF